MRNCITIQLKKDEILIKIAEEAEEKNIIESLKTKIKDLKKLYKDEKTPIKVVGKVLKNKEIEEIQKIIKEEIDVEIEFESPQMLGLYQIKKAFSKSIETSETKFYKGSLRCGQKVEFEGSIVIFGDVNSGAEVIASENIMIFGTLRGLAHAGAKGNKEAIIACNSVDCPQIRIANVIKEMEKDEEIPSSTYAYRYAYVGKDDEIIME